jgi:amidase
VATHHFEPARYHTTLGSHEPVLRLADGDTLITATLDASGRDAGGRSQSAPPNPMTGPFAVEGAEPGDTLAVHLERLTPNRRFGYGRALLAPNVVDPEAVPEFTRAAPADGGGCVWDVDVATWTATLESPATRLGRLTLPLAPMLGCFGVAPAGGEAISTATSGRHGGNMDYRGFVAGATAYFPVAVHGALFFLGDGHALQGAGEISGTGVEISLDVTCTLRLLKSHPSNWPRGEDERFVFTLGNARPLDQALQHATTEMMRWLQQRHGLDALAAAILLGHCVDYEIGNVYDPAYTVVCKVAKELLR